MLSSWLKNKGPVVRFFAIAVYSFVGWTLFMGVLVEFDWAWPRGLIFGVFMGIVASWFWRQYDAGQFR